MDKASDRELAARFGLTVLGFNGWTSSADRQSRVANIRSLNPSIKLAQYVWASEMYDVVALKDPLYPAWKAVNDNNWWARNAAGARVQWSTQFSDFVVNLTAWAPKDANGQSWAQVRAKWDTDTLLKSTPGIDYIFIDNFMPRPLLDADWKRIGTNQSRTDPEIQSAWRTGYLNYVAALRTLNPTLKVMGNTSEAPSSAEYKGQLEGAMRECMMGKSWSLETWKGWAAMMADYRLSLTSTKAPRDVIFHACGDTLNSSWMRYGLASALLEDGWFGFTVTGQSAPPWFDEYSAKIGTAAELPPTAATPSGIWTRKYSNGIVLVNPTAVTSSIDIGPGYKRISGTQDPATNNGLPAQMVTLLPKQGLILVKQ